MKFQHFSTVLSNFCLWLLLKVLFRYAVQGKFRTLVLGTWQWYFDWRLVSWMYWSHVALACVEPIRLDRSCTNVWLRQICPSEETQHMREAPQFCWSGVVAKQFLNPRSFKAANTITIKCWLSRSQRRRDWSTKMEYDTETRAKMGKNANSSEHVAWR